MTIVKNLRENHNGRITVTKLLGVSLVLIVASSYVSINKVVAAPLDGFSLLAEINLPVNNPLGVAVSQDNSRIYVVAAGDNPTLIVIDGRTNTIISSVAVPFFQPRVIGIHPSGNFVYTASDGEGKIGVFDTINGSFSKIISTESRFIRGLEVNPNGNEVYVSDDSSNIYVVSVPNHDIVNVIHSSGSGPRNIVFNQAGTRAYIANLGNQSISVVDTTTDSVINFISLADAGPSTVPFDLDITKDGTKLVVAEGRQISPLIIENFLTTIDLNSGNIVRVPFTERPFRIVLVKNDSVAIFTTTQGNLWAWEIGTSNFKQVLSLNYHFLLTTNGNQTLVYSGTFDGKIRIISTGSNTLIGSNVSVAVNNVSVTFAGVTMPGDTTVTQSETGTPPPTGFKLGSPPTYYQIGTTATYIGPVAVCINYDDTQFTGREDRLKVMHFENGIWIDTTTSLDTKNNIICGQVNSLSEFVLVIQEDINGLIELTKSFGLNKGIEISLTQKLEAR